MTRYSKQTNYEHVVVVCAVIYCWTAEFLYNDYYVEQ